MPTSKGTMRLAGTIERNCDKGIPKITNLPEQC